MVGPESTLLSSEAGVPVRRDPLGPVLTELG